MSELLTVAIGAIGALIGLAGLMFLGGSVFLVVLFFRKLPVGLRTALSTAATYCVAVTVISSYAPPAMALILLPSMFHPCGPFGLSGLLLSLVESLPLAEGLPARAVCRNRLAGFSGVRAASNNVAPDRKNRFSLPCEYVKVSPVMLS